MDKVILVIASLLLILFAPVIGVLFGAFSGAIVGLFFDDTLAQVSQMLFGQALPSWQLGAALGFLGGFFRVGQPSRN